MDKLFTLNALYFFGIATAGMFAHAIKKWVANEIDGQLIDWYVTNKKYTVGVVASAMGITAAAIVSGNYVSINDGGMVSSCFLAAYAIDGFNKQ